MKNFASIFIFLFSVFTSFSQNYTFDFNSHGRRVCPVSTTINTSVPSVEIHFLDYLQNSTEPLTINRRVLGTTAWTNVANNITPGTASWTDTNVSLGDIWEYQVIRNNTWWYNATQYNAIGYTIGSVMYDNTDYKGQMILLVADDISTNLTIKYNRLKSEIANDGWQVNEIIVPKATSWDSGSEVVTVKNQIEALYNAAPTNDKPQILFILGHVPMPRSGSTTVTAPDGHDENRGARGSNVFYADIDGVYTDAATFNPGGLSTTLAENYPDDFKWDQDFLASDVEMAFGRVDFYEVYVNGLSELTLIENYLDKLSAYKNADSNYLMGEKSGFNIGFENSTDASYRSLLNISEPSEVYENTTGSNHSQWVQNNGPFKIYMQNVSPPDVTEWETIGMDATVFSSDQSYWGFNDIPYSTIRTALAIPSTKNLITLWTTSAINLFHQACNGQPLGLAMKTIINHNASNQYLEKPQQGWDDPNWWNRMHLTINGDPTLNLYQIAPATNPSLSEVSGNAELQWTASSDTDVIGYHVYESTTEFGAFEKISTSIVTATNFTIPSYQQGNWYSVKAVKPIASGCGEFLHTSIGKSVYADLVLSEENFTTNSLQVFPNPTRDLVTIMNTTSLEKIEIYTINGSLLNSIPASGNLSETINLSNFENGIYLLKIYTVEGFVKTLKIVKN